MPFDARAARITIEKAVNDVVKIDKQIAHLKRGRVENTFVAEIAFSLKPLFESEAVSVDAHYNRHYNARKQRGGKDIELDIALVLGVEDHAGQVLALEWYAEGKRA